MIKKSFFAIVPIIISLFGLYYTYRVDQRTKYDEKPSLYCTKLMESFRAIIHFCK